MSAKIFLNLFVLFIFLVSACRDTREKADELYYNGTVYTVDSAFSVCTAMAVKDGKIIATGSDEEILSFSARTKVNLHGKFVYPGFQDAHCHFYGYGYDLKKIWLTGTSSFNEIIDTLKLNSHKKIGNWIFGRGWDQNDWAVKRYPDKAMLDLLFPDTPVILLRIDGHAALVNRKALELSGIDLSTKISGGLIEKAGNQLTGILVDKAVDLVYNIIPEASKNDNIDALLNAQKNCYSVGLTSVTDAGVHNTGLRHDLILLIDSLQKSGKLTMRMNVMAALEDISIYKSTGKIKTDRLNVRSFKLYTDGALGSRGACLLQPYSDQREHKGFLIHDPAYLDSIAGIVNSIGFQLNTHCIGDSAHRLMLQIYEKQHNGNNDHRWRIEHAQVINPEDLAYYKRNHIIPSVQPVHATSDMYWAETRLGPERIKGAYALKDLMKQNNLIAAGSDFPVENINPLYGFHAAVARKDHKGYPENGFIKENALSREEALRAMTIWASYAAFTENETGSIEPGKFADFVILEQDLMNAPEDQLWQIKVLSTVVNGKKVFER